MSEITQNFVVEPNNINITVDTNNINFTPNTTQLSIYSGSATKPGGSNTQLQYNNNDILGGIPNVTYNGSNLSLGNATTIKITGGTNGYVLQTDGTGNLDWTAMTGGGGNGTPGGSNTQIQYNDNGIFGGNVGFTFNEVSGNVNLPGNLTVVGNIFGSVQTANYSNFAGTVITNSQPNITSVGTLTSLGVSGTITSSTLISNVSTGTPPFTVTSTTQVANLNVATASVASTVTTNAQPNITSVGTLNSLSITGNLIAGNANLGNLASANFFQGNGALLTGISVSSGTFISNGTSNVSVTSINGNVSTSINGVSNILLVTSTGANLLGNFNVNGNITGTRLISNISTGTSPFIVTSTTQVANLNVATAGLATFATTANSVAGANVSGAVTSATTATTASTVTSNAQPNITSTGTLLYPTKYVGITSVLAAPTTVYNYDIITKGIFIDASGTGLTGNFTLNLRGNATTSFSSFMGTDGTWIEINLLVKNTGANTYFMSAVTTDGNPTNLYLNTTYPYVPPTNTKFLYKLMIQYDASFVDTVYGTVFPSYPN